MATRIDFNKLSSEFMKLADVEHLKQEANRIKSEIKKFDLQAHLTPTAKARIKEVEQRYKKFQKSLQSSQRTLDRELDKVIRRVKKQTLQAEAKIERFVTLAKSKSKVVESVAQDLKAAFAPTKASKKRKAAPRSSKPRATATRKPKA